MYVYLADGRSFVFLPTAVNIEEFVEESSTVAFRDTSGVVVAVFARSDVVMFSMHEVFDSSREAGKQGQ